MGKSSYDDIKWCLETLTLLVILINVLNLKLKAKRYAYIYIGMIPKNVYSVN